MKTLYLLRHAKSRRGLEWKKDFDRPLAGRGRRDAPAIGAWMRDAGRIPSLTLYSTARRAVETWRLVAPELGADVTDMADESLYLAAPERLFKAAAAAPDGHAGVMIIGHNPGLHELALALAGDGTADDLGRLAERYPTGALSAFRFDIDHWSDLQPKSGRLECLVFPRDLAAAE